MNVVLRTVNMTVDGKRSAHKFEKSAAKSSALKFDEIGESAKFSPKNLKLKH